MEGGLNFSDYNAGDLLWLGDWSPLWIAVLVCLGLVVLGVSLYDLRPLRPRRRWTLVALRTAVYGLAVLLLLEPAVDLKNVTKVKNHVPILVDASRSMALASGEATRFEHAEAVVEALDLPQTMEDEDHVYHVYTFGEGLEESSASLEGVVPDQLRSDLAGALRETAVRFERSDLGAIVVVSDGTETGGFAERTRAGEELDDVSASALDSLKTQVHTVGVVREEALKDVGIVKVVRDDFAFVHNKVSIDVEIQVVGIEPTSFPVKLIRDGRLLQTREVTIREGETRYPVSFEYVPKSIGKEIYTIEAPTFPGEILESNNRAHFLQKVIRDKVRALQVVGRPSWDERFLRRLLKRNPNVDLISFFILRTNQNVQIASTSELSLIPFPTRELFQEELGSFDIIIFQNFNFGPYDMRQYLPEIPEFVRRGGGFVMLGGDLSFADGGYSETPVEELLPVTLPGRGTRNTIDERPFRPELTEAGQRHPITQLAFDPASNAKIWSQLPFQKGTNIVAGSRDQATVLATHPRLTAQGEPMPVISVMEFGEGRTMALTTDSTWRWGFESLADGGTPREYQVFWNSAIRWLIKDPELKLLRVELADDEVSPGQPLEGTVRVQKSDYTPAPNVEASIVVTHRSFQDVAAGKPDRQVVLETKAVTAADGTFEFDVPTPTEGVFEVTARAQTESGDLRDVDVALSVLANDELRDVLPRPDLLEKIAEQTDATHATWDDVGAGTFQFAPPRTVRVNRRTVIQLWDSFPVFVIILLLLGLEWTLRRRWGRL